MNFSRYKFSKQCEPELLEFFKVVAEQDESSSRLSEVWKTLLPIDKEIQEKINSFRQVNGSNVECIVVSDDEIANESKLLIPNYCSVELISDESKLNITSTEDLIDAVKELLENETTLSNSIIKQFGCECSKQQLQDMFDCFGKTLNSQCTYNLWQSILQSNCTERSSIVEMFLKHIVCVKVYTEQDKTFKKLFCDIWKDVPQQTTAVFVELLLNSTNKNLRTVKSNLSFLPDTYKSVLLLFLLENCKQLELHQLEIFACLITKSSDNKNFNKLVELMMGASKDFGSNKIFGKLLFELVKNLGSSILEKEEQLKQIIVAHNSIFKNQIVKLFETHLQDVKLFSQSFPG